MEVIQRVQEPSPSPFLSDFKIDSPQLILDSSQIVLDSAQYLIDQLNTPLSQIDSPLLHLASSDSDDILSLTEESLSSLDGSPMYHENSPRLRHYLESTKTEIHFPLPDVKETKPQCAVCNKVTDEVINGIYKCTSCSRDLSSSDENAVGKPKKSKPVSPALKFPPCFVCTGKASGLHYGVNSCEACKGFFRRYLLRSEEYKCTKGGNCQITNRSRGNCSGCRLQKCLALGMSKCASKLGRYTLSQRTKTIMKVKELESSCSQPELGSANINSSTFPEVAGSQKKSPVQETGRKSPKGSLPGSRSRKGSLDESHCWTKDQESLLQILMNAMTNIKPYGETLMEDEIFEKMKSHYEKYTLKVEIFGQMTPVPEHEYYAILKNYGIDLDGRWEVLKKSKGELEGIIARYVSFAKQVPGFSSLPTNDQSNLLKVSRCDFFMILMHRGYIPEFKVFLAHNGQPYHLDEAADRFYSRRLVGGILDIYGKWQKLNLRKEEIPILMALSLTFPDRCKLENRQQVENMQKLMMENLWSLLLKTCPKSAAQRFAKMIDCFVSLREISEQYFTEYKKLCKNDLIIEEVPMMMEFFLEDW